MEEITLKSEMTRETLYRTLHLYQDRDRYILRRDLYKSKNRRTHLLSHEFEIVLISLKIHLPSGKFGDIDHLNPEYIDHPLSVLN
jgi:hypothetical protein